MKCKQLNAFKLIKNVLKMFSTADAMATTKGASLSRPVPDNGRLELQQQQQQHRRRWPQQQVEAAALLCLATGSCN